MFSGILCSSIDLWSKESDHKYCPNHVKPTIDVSSQKECQNQCESHKDNCVGISYSYKSGNTHHCYVCNDDDLSYGSNEFGFYRRESILINNVEKIFFMLRV